MKSLFHLLSVVLAAGSHLAAESLSVSRSEFEDFELDLDGDGEAELFSAHYSTENRELIILVTAFATELTNPRGTAILGSVGKQDFAGISMVSGSHPSEIVEADGFAATYTPPPAEPTSVAVGYPGYFLISETSPILATLQYGSSSQGTGILPLCGVVFDARRMFATNGEDPLVIHHHQFGNFETGGSPVWIDMRRTGFPVDSVAKLSSETEFPQPKRVCITVPSEADHLYQLIRRGSDGSIAVVTEVPGTGDDVLLDWTEPADQSSGIFHVQSVGPRAFEPPPAAP